jgi:hypothetical protein
LLRTDVDSCPGTFLRTARISDPKMDLATLGRLSERLDTLKVRL